ncbi:MAG TPA: hypothetical protein VNY74_04040 [Edaphobacter sp.]|nr:hypothetical protein [Edaphobacter sp.]
MKNLTGSLLFLSLHAFICCLPHTAFAAVARQIDSGNNQTVTWQSTSVQHAYGLPDTKKNAKGTLIVNPDGLTFTTKSSSSALPHRSIVAVSAGNQRVELWGMKGRLLRMAIPDGGGIAAAGVMHHRVDMLTVEFNDSRGGYHGAVFYLPANEAERALQSFAQMPPVSREAVNTVCQGGPVKPGSVLVSAPTWDQVEVPAAYRALVYEHLIDRLQHVQGIGHVYRDGESNTETGCPQYTVHIAIAGFAQGSQVKRAVMGPVGMFVGTTQMTFDAAFTDASGRWNTHEQVKATVRGESESINVADSVAKTIAKHYASAKKGFEKASVEGRTDLAHSR